MFSETSRIGLGWVKWLNKGNILLIIFAIAISSVTYVYPQYLNLLIPVNVAIITPYLYVITYKGISQSTLWRPSSKAGKEKLERDMEAARQIPVVKTSRQPRSGPDSNKIGEMAKQVLLAMEESRVYLEPELTLQIFRTDCNFRLTRCRWPSMRA